MGRYTPSDAEQAFLGALLEEAPFSKSGAELTPDTAASLGVESVSPSVLEQLEQQAAANSAPQEEPAAVDAEPPAEEDALPAPPLPSRKTHGKLFSDKQAHPLAIFDVLNERYQTQWVDWEPETLWWAIRKDFGPVGEVTRNKIGALRLAAVTDTPWLDWDAFENCGLAWNGMVPTIGVFEPLSPTQIAFTVHILRSIRPDEKFDTEVKAYMAAILDEYGWVYAPSMYFDGARELLERKVWLTALKTDVEEAWTVVKDRDPSTIKWRENDPVDVHVMKLFVVKGYLEEQKMRRKVPMPAPVQASTTSPPVPS